MNPFRQVADFIRSRFAPRQRSRERVAATYDAAQTTRHNQNHWGDSDYLSPNASTTVWIRHTLRSRSRLEAANNSLYAGILRSIADHTVGSGPKIQWLHQNRSINRALDSLWNEWDNASQFGDKLWLAKETQSRDGEAFALTIGNPKLESRIKLDYQLLEADYVTLLRPVWTPWQVDGITYDPQWNPVSYQIVTQRPNDILPIVWPQQHTVDASRVWHYFRRERPGQGRGVPDLVAAFELLAALRRYIAATVSAAEVAASFAAFIKTNGPPIADENGGSADAWLTLEIQRNLLTMLPDGYDVTQLKPEQPTQSFTEFVKTLLTLLVRCVSMPLNLALCDSSGYNYSSSRMDHQTYFRAIEIDRRRIERTILARVLKDFLAEAELILGFAKGTLRRVPHEWHWPRPVSADPQKDAASVREAIEAGQMSMIDAQKRGEIGGDVIRENAEYFGVSEDEMRRAQFEKLFVHEEAPQPQTDPVEPAPAKPGSSPVRPPAKRAAAKRKRRDPANLACTAPAADLHCAAESARLDVAAAAEGASDANEVPKFAMVGYTGGPMWLEGREHQLVIDLSTVEIASPQTPILFAHDEEQPVGHAAEVLVDGSGIFVPAGQGFFSAANDRRDEIVAGARRKYPWQASVGGRAATIEFIDAGETIDVNGRTFSGPIEVARGFRLREISILSLGADASTSAVLAARAARLKAGNAMPGFEEWVKSMGFDPATMSNPQLQAMQNLYQSQQTAASQEEQDRAAEEQQEAAAMEDEEAAEDLDQSDEFAEEDTEEEEEEERPATARRAAAGRQPTTTRAAARIPVRAGHGNRNGGRSGGRRIRAAARSVRISAERSFRKNISAEMRRAAAIRRECGANDDLAAKAIEEGWALEKLQLHVLRAERSQGVMAGPLGRPAGGPDANAVIECSMLLSIGGQARITEDMLPRLDRRYTQDVVHCAVERENRHYTFSRAFQEYLICHGRRPRCGSLDPETIEAAVMIADREIRAEPGAGGSSISTVSLPGILSNLLNKSLLASYLAVPVASDKFCGTQDLNDFKVATRYRLSAAGELEVVGSDATLKDFTLGEESWTNQLQTRGTKLTLSRQMLVNDDLDAFTFIPRLIGRKTALSIERAVFTLLLANANQSDGNAFFSAAHNNFLNGAGSALGVAGLTSAVPLFLKQTDKQGEPIVLAPAYVLVPPELVVTADQLYKDTNVITLLGTSTAAGKVVPNSNPFTGKYKPIESPYLSNGLVSGNSSTGWYLIADPADVPMISIGYLRGQRTPTVSQAMSDVSILGFTWQCFFDYGVGAVDWRAGVFNAGT